MIDTHIWNYESPCQHISITHLLAQEKGGEIEAYWREMHRVAEESLAGIEKEKKEVEEHKAQQHKSK